MGRIELIFLSIFLAFSISQSGMAQNQTLRINIELPAGVGLSSGSSTMQSPNKSSSYDVWTDLYDTKNFSLITEDGSLAPLIWIKMQTFENSQFLLNYRNKDEIGKKTFFYFLNDNTNNLQNAKSLKEFPALLSFNQKAMLIRNFVPRRVSLNSWLGIYKENQLETLILEYF